MAATPVQLFRRISTGVYVVTASHTDVSDGFTAAWVTQVSFDPLLLVVSVNPHNATWPLLQRSGRFVVNILKAGQHGIARHFGTTSGRDEDKMATVSTRMTDGALWLTEAAAWLDCRIEDYADAGDHVLAIGRVVGGDLLDPGALPLQYADTGDMDGGAALYPPVFPGPT